MYLPFRTRTINLLTDETRRMLGVLFRKTHKTFVAGLVPYTGTENDAYDLYMDSLTEVLYLYQNKKISMPVGDLEKYLWIVCKNQGLKKQPMTTVTLEEMPYTAEESREIGLNEIFEHIDAPCREILKMKILENKSHRQVSHTLGIAEESGRKKFQRCLQKIASSPFFVHLKKLYYE